MIHAYEVISTLSHLSQQTSLKQTILENAWAYQDLLLLTQENQSKTGF